MSKCRDELLVKKMNNDVYSLRREVINIIYRAKRLVPSLPRIEVRVCDNSERYSAFAVMGQCKIFVSENYVAALRTVYHEILHAVYRVPHVDGCPLMGPVYCEIGEEEADKLFVMYARKYQR